MLIHCQGGLGRTETTGAAYWIWNGLPAGAALDRFRKANPHAVEMPEQRACLHGFEEALSDPELGREISSPPS